MHSWNGIPVMPQAISGKADGESYTYTVAATVKQVQAYYDQEMPKVGWQPFATGTGDNGNLFLMYMKGSRVAAISVVAQGNSTLVLIVLT
ncbi:MAG: hypothetical protein AB1894_19960 [Chloroflexota bacterium]